MFTDFGFAEEVEEPWMTAGTEHPNNQEQEELMSSNEIKRLGISTGPNVTFGTMFETEACLPNSRFFTMPTCAWVCYSYYYLLWV